jgi:hypothetical protein
MTASTACANLNEQHRLHKPGVAGSSPAAATSVSICHTPADQYHLWPEPSCSQLKELRNSPRAFYWRYVAREAPPRQSDSLSYGTLLHTWAELGDAEFWARCVRPPDSLLTASGALSPSKASTWLADQEPGAVILTPADEAKLRPQTRNLLEDADVQLLLADRQDAEFNIRWQMGGHPVRCRVDGATSCFFYDWKTTRDEHPWSSWISSVVRYGYHMQSAMYADASVAIGYPHHRMRFIVTSTVWPYECFVCVLPERLVEKGRTLCLRLLDELALRREWDVWSRLDAAHGVRELPCPAWALKGDE